MDTDHFIQKIKNLETKLHDLEQSSNLERSEIDSVKTGLNQIRKELEEQGLKVSGLDSLPAENEPIDYENLARNAFDGILINDKDGNYVYANDRASEISGYSVPELLTLNIKDLSPPSEVKAIQERSKQTIEGRNRPKAFESFLLRKDHTKVPIEVAATRTYWKGKSADMVFVRDITQRKFNEYTINKQNEELRELNAVKDKLISIIAHDLKDPFHHLQGFSELLLRNHDTYSKEEREYFIRLIYNSTKQTYGLLENLLMWGRSQSGRISFAPENVNLQELFQEALAMVSPSAESKRLNLEAEVDEELTAYADREMVNTILRNLLLNAVKFSPEQKNITLHAEMYSPEKVVIKVSDEGMGIPEEIQPELFRIDQPYSSKGTRGEEGTGLGLIICKEFVEKNKGSIWLESKPNEGTTFYFTLDREGPC